MSINVYNCGPLKEKHTITGFNYEVSHTIKVFLALKMETLHGSLKRKSLLHLKYKI